MTGGAPAPRHFAPSYLWTVDFKGWWRTLGGTRCAPLTVRDVAMSRSEFLIAAHMPS